ncbi:hypothetical protein TPR58_10115 [Sphingomonas sp. HF-S3]|uniref:Uncharacterized protein n=1 Tax=Sphingomonas rustica TaxID=3103142 RepID=A0ABV0B7G9_9SPHN
MSDKRDLTGVWYGRYTGDYEDNGFIALLNEQGGAVDGSVSERDPNGIVDIRRASVSGTRDGTAVRFVKQYDGSGGFDHAVFYSGMIDGDGTEVSGRWQIDRYNSGGFVMTRESFTADELAEEREAELDAPVR